GIESYPRAKIPWPGLGCSGKRPHHGGNETLYRMDFLRARTTSTTKYANKPRNESVAPVLMNRFQTIGKTKLVKAV
ncbi:MAG TPA: hypothetical protein VGR56_08440, partial [Nitrososphaerales archaeon]|nr:hypothetical protein [Nitrososphaerales archaeon]